MSWLLIEAYARLVVFDSYLLRHNFEALYNKVRACPTAKPSGASASQISAAVDVACIWYWKQVLCLQRSAAAVCLLRKHGIPAQLVIGAQQIPFKAHAWVEAEGRVLNDKPYVSQLYLVLDRC